MHGLPRIVCCALIVAIANVAFADDAKLLALPSSASVGVAPMLDDAGLRDVKFVGTQIGWAVGDRGVIWKTDDGGQNWQVVPSPVDCTLRSVCFLTDRVGWVAGGGTIPHTRQGFGVVLATNDGGATWQQLGGDTLPQLCYVRFFDKEHGVVAGDATAEHPTGILTTEDGGKTWLPIAGKQQAGWRAADFVAHDLGIVAGLQGQTSLVGEKKLMPTRLQSLGLRGMHAVKLQPSGKGWLVGDGGLVLSTESGGLAWQEPATPLPLELNDVFDFHAVAARDNRAWIAGSPGSVIWHTGDGGRTWQQQPTGQTVPISALDFSDDAHGWAVGELGTILKTEDGGRTWAAVRGQGRRAALIAMFPRASRVAFPVIAHESAENGYRSLIFLPARRDVGPDGTAEQDQDLRLSDAVLAAGGSAGIVGWQLPVAAPDIEHNRELLIDDWKRRTDKDLSETMLGSLVCRLRTWRPNVVILDRPADDDAVGNVFNEAMLKAVEQAADETRFVTQRQLAGLGPWQVDKVFARMPEKSQGDVEVDPYEFLPRLGRTLHEVSTPAQSRLTVLPRQMVSADAYKLVFHGANIPEADVAKHDFFSGLFLRPGSEARRMLSPSDGSDDEARRKVAQKQRNFQAYAEQFLDDPRHAAQIIAQLSYVTQGMTSEQGATQLAQLAEDYRQRSDWDLYESTLVELVERYGKEPVALDAMRRLLQMWSGIEPVWQRSRAVRIDQKKLTLDTSALSKRVDKAIEASRNGTAAQSTAEMELGPDPLSVIELPASLKVGGSNDWRSAVALRWNQQAMGMAKLIRDKSPRFYRSPEVQFSVAALMRSRGGHRFADEFYHRWLRNGDVVGWNGAAAAELWLATPHGASPMKMSICRRASSPPFLDGVLSDDCWQQADENSLTSPKDGAMSAAQPALVLMSYDSRFLYIAASVPRDRRAPDAPPNLEGRTHDADLTGFDRVNICLDLDRDYATHYTLTVDQRGWTTESCCDDLAWNPQWHVAARGDEGHGRIEAAIPFEELAPSAAAKNDVWAVKMIRTIPAVGVQSWTPSGATTPRPETFGLVRFD